MDRRLFFNLVREKFGALDQKQVEGFEKIIDEAVRRGTMLKRLAYLLATTWHETAHKMQPIREMGGETYLKGKPYYPWVGEGLVQVTWEANHRRFGATKPGQLLTWPIALKALFDGCELGIFTGKKLSDYIDAGKTDYVNARKVVNGLDRAELIAGYARTFQSALEASRYGEPFQTAPDMEPPPAPIPAPPKEGFQKPSIQTVMAGIMVAVVAGVVALLSQCSGS